MAMLVTCPTCGTTDEVQRAEIVGRTWRRRCPACHPPERGDPAPATCAHCGRPLRSVRARCAVCLGVAA